MIKIIDLKHKPEYLKPLSQWHHEQWAYLNPGQSLSDRQESMGSFLQDQFIPSTYCAEFNNQVVGSAAIIDNDMDSHPELSPWLASVYVAPSWRKQGIATTLMRHIIKQAKSHDIGQLYLFTPDEEDFYLARGWELIRRETYRDSDVSLMQYTIEKAVPF